MAKPMRNKKRQESKLLESRVLLIDKAMDEGFLTKTDIAKATGLKIWDVVNTFTRDRELYAKFCIRRRTLVDTAADNIQAIVNDKDHPQNYQASKFVVSTYKSDLDEILESKDIDDISVLVEGGESSSPVTIVFGKKKQEEE